MFMSSVAIRRVKVELVKLKLELEVKPMWMYIQWSSGTDSCLQYDTLIFPLETGWVWVTHTFYSTAVRCSAERAKSSVMAEMGLNNMTVVHQHCSLCFVYYECWHHVNRPFTPAQNHYINSCAVKLLFIFSHVKCALCVQRWKFILQKPDIILCFKNGMYTIWQGRHKNVWVSGVGGLDVYHISELEPVFVTV